jgi:methionyl-tRNA formyltransferase
VSLPSPPARLSLVPEQVRVAILDAGDNEWTEKVRRFCSLHGRHLRRQSRKRFGAEADAHLQWMASLLLLVPDRCQLPCDPARLSAALHAIDAQEAAPSVQAIRASESIAALSEWHRAGNRQLDVPAQGSVFSYSTGLWRAESRHAPQVLVISPNPYSLYTIATMQLCLHLNIPIAGLLLRSFTPARFVSEYRRDGPRLLRKIWRKLVLRTDENPDRSALSISSLLRALGNQESDARRLARAHKIPTLSAAEWNSGSVESWIKGRSPQIGLFTGGGMTGAGLQSCFSTGILNVHMGHLPQYKGMDVVENPLLEGRRGNIGATAHLMDEGLDTGPIIQRINFCPDSSNSLGSLRNKIAGLMPLAAIDSALGLNSGRLPLVHQEKRGRQYYFIHPRLRPVLETAIVSHSSEGPAPYANIYDKLLADLKR